MSIEQNTKILASDVVNSLSEKAPTSHASNDITYGVGTDTDYGHVKLSDSVSTLDSLSGTAVSPKAVDDGLSSLFDDIITAAENAANTTTIPDNVAVELSNKIDELTVKNTEQDEVIEGKLDKSGGTMTGPLRFQNGFGFENTNDTYKGVWLNREGSTAIAAFAVDSPNYPGMVFLRASDNEQTCDLWARPNGELIWNNHNVVRSVNGVNADATGNVTIGYEAGDSIAFGYHTTAVLNSTRVIDVMIPLTLPIHATSASITGKVAARHSSSYLIPSMTDMAIYNPEIKSISPSGIWLRLTNPNGDFLSVNGLAIAIQFQNCVLSFS